MNSESVDIRDDFENSFSRFVQALEVLSHAPEVQCEEMGDCNTSWEIKDDATSHGLASLRMSALYLSWEQTEKMVDLVAALRRLPKEAIVPISMTTTNHAGSITAMSHPAWAPLREEAKQLLALLESAIRRNRAYFKED